MNRHHTKRLRLQQLQEKLTELRQQIIDDAQTRIQRLDRLPDDPGLSNSILNLCYYLAFRSHDIRDLQNALTEEGLSSLGHGETYILTNIDRVLQMLAMASGMDVPLEEPPVNDLQQQGGDKLLSQRTDHLFGQPDQQPRARIMVTLPTEAAQNPEIVHNLVLAGMDCARINCAHDDPQTWQKMIEHIRLAESSGQRRCRIFMDLAGHKIRTGVIAPQEFRKSIRKMVDSKGRKKPRNEVFIISYSRMLTSKPVLDDRYITVPDDFYTKIHQGDVLKLVTASRKPRLIDIHSKQETHCNASCGKSIHIQSGSELTLIRLHGKSEKSIASVVLQNYQPKPETIRIHVGDRLRLTRQPVPGEAARLDETGEVLAPAHISCSSPEAMTGLKPGESVWIDDGKTGGIIESVDDDGVTIHITRAGPKGVRLKQDKGINFPDSELNLPPLSDKDYQDLDFVCHHGDIIGYSFVESMDDMHALLHELRQRHAGHLPVVAKIETKKAVKNLPDIILGCLSMPHELGIMIARGDLAIELGSVRMAEIQEEILWICEAAHIPVIWATQVLETLAKKGITSRPEITDAAMSVRAECVMMNKGPYISDAVKALSNILTRMQAHQYKKNARLRALQFFSDM